MNNEKKRNSNLEILRIISMIFIVAHHYAVHGFNNIEMTYSFNRYIVGFLSLGGKLGVVIFVLISGYFMVYSKFTIYKLLKLILEVFFYNVGIGMVFLFILTPVNPILIKDIKKMFVPIAYSQYWFMTDYVLLMLISPVLNITISKISKEMHRNILIIATVLWSIVPSLISAGYGFNAFGWFIVLYFFAAYIRKFINTNNRNAFKHFVVAFISYMLVIISNIILIYLEYIKNINLFSDADLHFSALNSPFILLTSIELLIAFIKLKPYSNQLLNKLASATLGVYLIHDNNIFRPYLWIRILKNSEFYWSKSLILHAIFSILLVYFICSCIDLLRQNTVEKIFLKILDKYLETIEIKLCNISKNWGNKIKFLINSYYTNHY